MIKIKVFENYEVFFQLSVSKTRKEMLRLINKNCPKNNCNKDTSGYFRANNYILDDKIPGWFSSNIIGTIYLNFADIEDKIIVHECGHLAFTYHRFWRRYTGNFHHDQNYGEFIANGEGDEQEVFCYFLENAFWQIKQAVTNLKKI
jgi:hypothetical protein